MNRTLVILSLIVISVALSISVYAYSKGTASFNVNYKIADAITLRDGTVIKYTPYCLVNCYLPIEVWYSGTVATSTKSLQISDLAWKKNLISGADNLKSIEYYYIINETFTVPRWIENVSCINQTINTNGSASWLNNCIDNGKYVDTYEWGWSLKPISSITLTKDKHYTIVLIGRRTASDKISAVDIVPSLYTYEMPEMAWFNTSLSSRKNESFTGGSPMGAELLEFNATNLILNYNCSEVHAVNYNGDEIPLGVRNNSGASASKGSQWCKLFILANTTNPNITIYFNSLSYYPPTNTLSDIRYVRFDNLKNGMYEAYNSSSDTSRWISKNTMTATQTDYYLNVTSSGGTGYMTSLAGIYATPNDWVMNNYCFQFGIHTFVVGNTYTNAGFIDNSGGNVWSAFFMGFGAGGSGRAKEHDNGYLTYTFYNSTYPNAQKDYDYTECFTSETARINSSSVRWVTNTSYNTNGNWAGTDSLARAYTGRWIGFGHDDSAAHTIGIRWVMAYSTNVFNFSNTNWSITQTDVESLGGYPLWSNRWNNSITTYSPTQASIFNITWSNGSSSSVVNISAVNFTSNYSGSYANYNMSYLNGNTLSANFTYSKIFPAGVFVWNSTAVSNDSSPMSNTSSMITFTISKAAPTCTLSLTPTTPISYETNTTATCSCNNTDTGVTVKLYRNNTDITSLNNTAYSLAAETYNFVCNSTLTTNYSAATTNSNYVVNKRNSNVGIYPTTMPITYNASITQYCTDNSSFYQCQLWRNDTLLSNNSNIVLGVGAYVYVSNITDIVNYTNYQTTSTLTVNQGTPTETISFTPSSTVTAGTVVNISCSASTSQVTPALYNSTGIMANPFTLDTTGLSGGYNYVCNNTATANYTYATGSGTLTVTAGSGLAVNVFNEENTSQALAFNITVNNGTFSNTAYNQNNPYANNSILGLITIDISAANYLPRTYYTSVTAGNTTTVNAYLLSTASGASVLFYTYTVAEMPIPQALINVERLVPPSSYLTIAQKRTDTSGSASIYLSPTTTYRINVSATGYSTISSTLQPSASPYVFYMSEGAFNITYDTMFKNIWLEVKPDDAAIIFNQTYPFFYYLNSSDASLEFFGWKLTSTNGTIFVTNNTSTATGGNLTYSLNTLAGYMNETYTLNYWFKKDGFSLFNMTNYYYVYEVEYANTSIYAELMDLKADASQVSEQQFAFISVLISIICMAAASSQFKMFGSGMIGIGVMALFTSMGIIIFGAGYVLGWYLLGLYLLAVIAAIMIRGGFG